MNFSLNQNADANPNPNLTPKQLERMVQKQTIKANKRLQKEALIAEKSLLREKESLQMND